MDKFEQKYGFKEDGKVEAFHRSRRMFCFYQGKLYIADADLPYSHATWFETEGWMSKENDALMNQIMRGIVDTNAHIYGGLIKSEPGTIWPAAKAYGTIKENIK